MKIMVELLHPAHVHLYKFAIKKWEDSGHEVFIMSRDKDCTLSLIQSLGWKHTVLSKKYPWWLAGFGEYLYRCTRLAWQIIRKKPDVITGVMGLTVAPLGRLLGVPTCVFYDTEIAKISNKISFACSDLVLVPSTFRDMENNSKIIRYDSFHELAYLHPNLFTVLPRSASHYALKGRAKILLRFVSSSSAHDLKIQDLNIDQKLRLIQMLEIFGDIWVSSEAPLPAKLKRACQEILPHEFHKTLADCDLVVGESATVCSEAAMLGVPSIFISGSWRGYIDQLDEIYGLVQRLAPEHLDQVPAICLATLENPLSLYQKRRDRMISEKGELSGLIARAVTGLIKSP